MHILLVHNRYRYLGGEDVVFDSERALLEAMGHRVESLEWDSAKIPARLSPRRAVALAVDAVWSRSAAKAVSVAVQAQRPDVVHFHNTFPLISPASLRAAWRAGAATVQRLPNYRPICANAHLYRSGRICHDCVGKVIPWPAVAHSCYRGSRSASSIIAITQLTHRLSGTWRRYVDLFVTPSEVTRQEYVAAGFQADRVVVKPNMVGRTAVAPRRGGGGMLFVGRLETAKGVTTMLDAWEAIRGDIALRVVGTGPLLPRVMAAADRDRRIDVIGEAPHEAVLQMMTEADALIFPSEWLEPFGMSVGEAFAAGLPVITSSLGGPATFVEHGQTGLVFAAGDAGDLAAAVMWSATHPSELEAMGARARSVYEVRLTPERNHGLLMDFYGRAMVNHRQAAPVNR